MAARVRRTMRVGMQSIFWFIELARHSVLSDVDGFCCLDFRDGKAGVGVSDGILRCKRQVHAGAAFAINSGFMGLCGVCS